MRGGRNGVRIAGLYGMRISGGSIISSNSITGTTSLPLSLTLTLWSTDRLVLCSVKGSRIPVWPDSNLSELVAEAAYTPVPSPAITARANTPNKTLDLRLSLPFLFPIHILLIITSLFLSIVALAKVASLSSQQQQHSFLVALPIGMAKSINNGSNVADSANGLKHLAAIDIV